MRRKSAIGQPEAAFVIWPIPSRPTSRVLSEPMGQPEFIAQPTFLGR
jgi:hypothetical protein